MTSLEDRINLMRQAGMLAEQDCQCVQDLCSYFRIVYGIDLTEENASAFITHFCMALNRRQADESIAAMDALVREDIELDDDYENARYITEDIFRQVVPLPENERDYIMLHVLMVLKKVRKDYDDMICAQEQ